MSFRDWLRKDGNMKKYEIVILILAVTIVTELLGFLSSLGGLALIMIAEYLAYLMGKEGETL